MAISSITVGTNSYTLVTPANGLNLTTVAASIVPMMADTVGVLVNKFSQQTQTQNWAGGDFWSFKVTLPAMTRRQASPWLAFLASLRGMTNVFQLGDGAAQTPMGSAAGAPVVAAATNAMATSLSTSGWTPSASNVLLCGDYIQVGFRLYMVVDDSVTADSSGNATFNIWPSVREAITVNTEIMTSNTTGLFRLAGNQRQWSYSPAQLTQISFSAMEAR